MQSIRSSYLTDFIRLKRSSLQYYLGLYLTFCSESRSRASFAAAPLHIKPEEVAQNGGSRLHHGCKQVRSQGNIGQSLWLDPYPAQSGTHNDGVATHGSGS